MNNYYYKATSKVIPHVWKILVQGLFPLRRGTCWVEFLTPYNTQCIWWNKDIGTSLGVHKARVVHFCPNVLPLSATVNELMQNVTLGPVESEIISYKKCVRLPSVVVLWVNCCQKVNRERKLWSITFKMDFWPGRSITDFFSIQIYRQILNPWVKLCRFHKERNLIIRVMHGHFQALQDEVVGL